MAIGTEKRFGGPHALPGAADLLVHVYLGVHTMGTTPDGQPWSFWNLDRADIGTYLGRYRLGALRWH